MGSIADLNPSLKDHRDSTPDTQGRNPILSVVVPTHRRPNDIAKLLQGLDRQDFSSSDLEVLIVTNFPEPELGPLCENVAPRLPVRVLTAGALGSNRARNFGLQNARGEFYLFLDDDCRLPNENYLGRLVELHRQYPQACALGGAYLSPENITSAGRHYNWISNQWLRARFDGPFPTTRLIGGCVSYKGAFLRQGNWRFNDSIVYGGAETDFHVRLLAARHQLYFHPELSVVHDCPISSNDLWYKAVAQGYGKAKRKADAIIETPIADAGPLFWSRLLKDSEEFDLYRRGFAAGETLFRLNLEPRRQGTSWLGILFSIFSHFQTAAIFRKARRSVRIPIKWAYWRLHDTFWLFYHASCEARGFAMRTRSRAHVGLIRTYWTLYPIFSHLKHHWRSPRSLASVRMPLTHPTIETQPDYRWTFSIADELPISEKPRKQLEFERLGLVSKQHTENRHELSISQINALSSSRLQALVTSHAPAAIHFVLDEVPRGPALIKVVDWLHSAPSTKLSYELTANVRSDLFDYFRILHGFSVRTERLRKRWQAQYQYKDHEGRLWRRHGFWPALNAPEKPCISIVIPHHDDFENLSLVLKHLERQSFDQPFEVIVIDNAVQDRLLTDKQIARLRESTLPLTVVSLLSFSDEAFLSGTARNQGLVHASGELILFLDSDILLPPDFLQNLLQDSAKADVIMAKRWMLKEGLDRISADDLYPEDEYWENLKRAKNWTDVPDYWKYSCTYCFAAHRRNLLRSGPFDPAFTTYGFEDVDLGFRLYKLGLRFAFAQKPSYHLFPRPRNHSYHTQSGKRERTLAESALIFFKLRPEKLPFVICQGYFAPSLWRWISLPFRRGAR